MKQPSSAAAYPRDMLGYGAAMPDPKWPNPNGKPSADGTKGDARIAVQFVINYEEGGENNILHGDAASEAFLSEIVGAAAWPNQRHWNMESIYEYGARAGFWRLHRMFTAADIPVTVYGVATALERSPDQTKAMVDAGWEIASHGLKWIEYKDYTEADERAHMDEAIAIHTRVTGTAPLGWYTGRCSVNTVRIAAEQGSFAYVSDSYADDLPYWSSFGDDNQYHQLIVPYTLDCNDMRFATPQGFNSGKQFYHYLKDTFDVLYKEGKQGAPKMMSIGLHCRLVGRPGRAAALAKFIKYAKSHKDVWFARRIDIANHWAATHPLVREKTNYASSPASTEFVAQFSDIFEHSPWVAERSLIHGARDAKTAEDLHDAMCSAFRAGSDEERLDVLRAHPDLAGKLAAAKSLTPDSTKEQAGAGLDLLTDDERAYFQTLNAAYGDGFGFPFIIAVKGKNKADILNAFEIRLQNDVATERDAAEREVEKIALFRLRGLLPSRNPIKESDGNA